MCAFLQGIVPEPMKLAPATPLQKGCHGRVISRPWEPTKCLYMRTMPLLGRSRHGETTTLIAGSQQNCLCKHIWWWQHYITTRLVLLWIFSLWRREMLKFSILLPPPPTPPKEKKSALLHRNLSDLSWVTQIKCVHCSAETHLTQLNSSLVNEMK